MKKRILSILIIFAVFFAIPNVYAEYRNESNEEGTYTVTVSGEYNYDYALEMFNLVNKERTAAGLSTLELDKELTEIAMNRAKEISVYADKNHTRPNGKSWDTISTRGDEENYAYLLYSPKKAVEAFMNSESHRNAILNSERKSVGIGCYTSYGKIFWVQIFSSEEKQEDMTITGIVEKEDIVEVKEEFLNYNVFYNGGSNPITVSKGNKNTVSRIQHINLLSSGIEINLSTSDFKWESSNPDIFTVDENGEITGVSAGNATLLVSIGNSKKEYPVQVTFDFESIVLPKDVKIKKGNTQEMNFTLLPIGSSIPQYLFPEWSSSNPSVAIINSAGKITAKEVGTTTITLKVGQYEVSTEVIVYEPKFGDATGDGKVDLKDIYKSISMVVRRNQIIEETNKLVDVNGNKRVDFFDIYYIMYTVFNRK